MHVGYVLTEGDVARIEELEELGACVRAMLSRRWPRVCLPERELLEKRIAWIDDATGPDRAERPTVKALTAFCSTIENTGGVELTTSAARPQADRDWVDLGDAYVLACTALYRDPKVLKRRTVRRWMQGNADNYDNCTTLAEGAAEAFDLYAGDGSTILEWVFELALDYDPTDSKPADSNTEDE